MKSAYERAMDRFGSAPLTTLSAEQKTAIAEVDRLFKSRLAEAELNFQERLKRPMKPEELEKARQEYAVETASLRDRAEREKNKIRQADEQA